MYVKFKRVNSKKFNEFIGPNDKIKFSLREGKILSNCFISKNGKRPVLAYFYISLEEKLKFFIRKDLL